MLKHPLSALCLGLLASLPATAAEKDLKLKAAAGHDTVENNCSLCHSLDYIPMNSPFLQEKGWDAEVHKMMKAFGAPIDEKDARIIIEYLTKNYAG
jgi:mono/diheme cytochrome c family protein